MKICSNCGASNPEANRFCSECGHTLTALEEPKTGGKREDGLSAGDVAASIAKQARTLGAGRQADVLFVLDCTGSMWGEIDAIRESIVDFADTIKSDGIRVRVGLIAFRDRTIGEEPEVLRFARSPFTENPEAFRREVMRLEATGGGPEPESSLDAMMLALHQPFGPDRNKVIVLVTDAPPRIPDKDTANVEEVVQQIKKTGIDQIYLVIRTTSSSSQVYLRLLEGSGAKGMAFDLGRGDDFRKRADRFKRNLMSLGKTISTATR